MGVFSLRLWENTQRRAETKGHEPSHFCESTRKTKGKQELDPAVEERAGGRMRALAPCLFRDVSRDPICMSNASQSENALPSSTSPRSRPRALSVLCLVMVLVAAPRMWAAKHPVPLDPKADAKSCLECHSDKTKGKSVHS